MRDIYTAVDHLVLAEEFSASEVCRILEVSRSGFAAWRSRQTSRRERRDRELAPVIQEIFWRHRRRYGARRIAAELNRRDIACGVAKVARLMKTAALQAIRPKSFTPKTTESRHHLGYNANLLIRRELPQRINEVWVGDKQPKPPTDQGGKRLRAVVPNSLADRPVRVFDAADGFVFPECRRLGGRVVDE